MKNLTFVLAVILLGGFQLSAQNNGLVEDQNPNYRNSMNKYMEKKEDLTATQGTTVQDTYFAFDRYENKIQKKLTKQENKQERRLAKINNRGRAIPYNPFMMGGFGPSMHGGFNSGMHMNRNLNSGFNNRYCPPLGGFNSFNNFSPWNRGGMMGWGW